jgi:hypothetical protein
MHMKLLFTRASNDPGKDAPSTWAMWKVGAASHRGPGVWSTQAQLADLQDYAIVVTTSAKKNLEIMIHAPNSQLIGLGTSRSLDHEFVFLSNEWHQTGTIHVVNTAPVPVSFEISVQKIQR